MKLFFLMLDNETGPWNKLYLEGAESTWTNQLMPEQEIYIRYKGKVWNGLPFKFFNRLINSKLRKKIWSLRAKFISPKIELDYVEKKENCIEVNLLDLWWNIGWKTLLALKYIHSNFEYDYIVRGNASVYYDLKNLREFLQLNNPSYCGPIEKNKEFVSGWSIILSRRAVEILLSNSDQLILQEFDDEAIGGILRKAGIFPEEIPFMVINSLEAAQNYAERKIPVLRLKYYINTNRRDYELMKIIYEKTFKDYHPIS